MPYGLKNASATFQRIMDTAFKWSEMSYVIVYEDDIILSGTTLGALEGYSNKVRGRGSENKTIKI